MSFIKGQKAWNKGVKGRQKNHNISGLTPGWNRGTIGIMKSNKTSFKKGLVPWNKGLGSNIKRTRKETSTPQYNNWRKSVFERDDYTCQRCGDRGVRLVADHIKMWVLFPDLRFDISNGQTLCRVCDKEKTRTDMKLYWKNQYTESNLRKQIS